MVGDLIGKLSIDNTSSAHKLHNEFYKYEILPPCHQNEYDTETVLEVPFNSICFENENCEQMVSNIRCIVSVLILNL